MYEKFELVLPRNCKINRNKNNEIVLNSDILNISIKAEIDKYAINLPEDFLELYLGLKDVAQKRYNPLRVKIKIKSKLKVKSLFLKTGWNYYLWLDKFLEYVRREFSMKDFFDSVSWKSIRALQHVTKINKKKITKI